MIPWTDIREKILAKEPKAAPFLEIVAKYWGDGKLTEDIANRFITAWMNRNFVGARKLLYGSMTANDLIAVDKAENQRLAAMIEQERKLYDFAAELEAALLKVALGVVLAAVGL
ncbi:MAG TPA: hypothetical protein VNA25_23210 [Phycisphaerae bacterium]|nr:hypothetical protein [Phycisphaerae bacterium]